MSVFAAIGLFVAGMAVGEYYNHKVDRIRKEQLDEYKRPRTVADVRNERR